MSREIKNYFNQGSEYAKMALLANEPAIYWDSVEKALRRLIPISSSEHCFPEAAFFIGVIACDVAERINNSAVIDGDDEDELPRVYHYFGLAEKYLKISSGMKDYQNDFAPARAKCLLADLHERGAIGEGGNDYKAAFDLRLEAAEAGFAEAQAKVAFMYYNGEGANADIFKANEWIDKAWDNKGRLSVDTRKAVLDFRKNREIVLRKAPKPKSRIFVVEVGGARALYEYRL